MAEQQNNRKSFWQNTKNRIEIVAKKMENRIYTVCDRTEFLCNSAHLAALLKKKSGDIFF